MPSKTLATRTIAYMQENMITRVLLPDVVEFFCASKGTSFRTLPALPRHELSPENKARNDVQGWVVPVTSYGRLYDRMVRENITIAPNRSTAQTIATWIRDRLLPSIHAVGGPAIDPHSVSVHLERRGKSVSVVIYRCK